MKKLSYPLIAAVAGILIASASQAVAGGSSGCCSSTCCNDGIAASPKVRAMLDERCKSRCATPGQVTKTTITRQTDVAASPKLQQMRSEQARSAATPAVSETAGYQPTGSDGITASPKLRAQLNERPHTVEIAPLK